MQLMAGGTKVPDFMRALQVFNIFVHGSNISLQGTLLGACLVLHMQGVSNHGAAGLSCSGCDKPRGWKSGINDTPPPSRAVHHKSECAPAKSGI